MKEDKGLVAKGICVKETNESKKRTAMRGMIMGIKKEL